MWNCKHCEKLFDFDKTADKANHSRWCESNPNISIYKNNPNLAKAVQKSKDKKYGEEKNFLVSCDKCTKEFFVIERELSFPSKKKYFCSRSCANSHVVTDEHKKKTSSTLTGKPYVDPFEVTKNCDICNKPFTYIKHYSKKDKQICGQACANKKRGELKRLQRPALTNYRADCAFKFNLKDYPDEFNFKLVEEYGWYKAKNRGDNLTGISRDHMISVRYGFDNDIPAEHLAHPANCRLIQHGKNVSKGTQNSISYQELLMKIDQWDKKYPN
jgi:hypothetical protein